MKPAPRGTVFYIGPLRGYVADEYGDLRSIYWSYHNTQVGSTHSARAELLQELVEASKDVVVLTQEQRELEALDGRLP